MLAAGDGRLAMPEVPADEAVTNSVVAYEEEPTDSGVVPESSPADLPQDFDDFEPSMDATFDDASDEFMEAKSSPLVVEEGCEAIGEVSPSSSGLEQGAPEVDREVGATSTSFGAAEMKPHDEIPSPTSSIGQSLLTIPPMKHDRGSRPMKRGETSSGPSLQYAKRVLKSVLSSWIETLSSGHLEAGFGMLKHVQDIFAEREEVGLDIASAKAFVDEVIALGNKYEFANSEAVRSGEEHHQELAIIELTQDLHRLDRELIEARQRLELLEEQAAAKWTAIMEARTKEGTLIRQVEEADSNLWRKTREYEQWQILWEELPRADDGLQRFAAFYGNILKKCSLKALEAEAKSLLKELNLWLKTILD
ncbi:hypothetical protein AAC387_Pa01g2140 [Persea americana]